MTSGPRAVAALYGILRRRHADRNAVLAFQSSRLRTLVAHAYERVPYYRELFDRQGLRPGDIRTIEDLASIPLTSRLDLQAQSVERVVARGTDPARLITYTTSGSSGRPLVIRRTWIETRLLQAVRVRALHEQGLRARDRVASVEIEWPPHVNDRPFHVNLVRSLGLYRHSTVNCLASPREILAALAAAAPDVLGGFSGVLARVAERATEQERRRLQPRLAIVGGDVLTPLMRQQIREAFGAPVLELYASVECALIASECPHTGDLHLAEDGVIVEVLDGGKPVAAGQRGEVVVTNLHAFAMPFIRYRLGDVVTKGQETCRCGKPYGTIRAIQGRMNDYFLLPGGRTLHPYEMVLPLLREAMGWLRQYRLVQEREDRVALLVVPSVAPTARELAAARRVVSSVLGDDVEFEIRFESELELERTGKFRVSRSLVRSEYDEVNASVPRRN